MKTRHAQPCTSMHNHAAAAAAPWHQGLLPQPVGWQAPPPYNSSTHQTHSGSSGHQYI
ncbi:hypothetical protein [Bartonella sp. AC140YNZD]|uniref:hypothetical protein n=1 Tax=Bartonella sp. AC140YNZD TaxID=3243447 RepID=UPI0035D0535F